MTKRRKKKTPAECRRIRLRNLAKGGAFQWKPGQSGNPNGRPKSKQLSKAYREILLSTIPGDPFGRTVAEVIAQSMAHSALAGNVSAASELADRTEGRPPVAIDVTEHNPLLDLIDSMKKRSAEIGPPEGMEEEN